MSPIAGLDPLTPILGGTDNPGGSTAGNNPGGGVLTEPAGGPPSGAAQTAFISKLGGGSDVVLPAGMAAIPASGAGFEAPDSGAFGEDPSGGVTREPDGTLRIHGEGETAGAEAVTDERAPSAFPEPTP